MKLKTSVKNPFETFCFYKCSEILQTLVKIYWYLLFKTHENDTFSSLKIILDYISESNDDNELFLQLNFPQKNLPS